MLTELKALRDAAIRAAFTLEQIDLSLANTVGALPRELREARYRAADLRAAISAAEVAILLANAPRPQRPDPTVWHVKVTDSGRDMVRNLPEGNLAFTVQSRSSSKRLPSIILRRFSKRFPEAKSIEVEAAK